MAKWEPHFGWKKQIDGIFWPLLIFKIELMRRRMALGQIKIILQVKNSFRENLSPFITEIYY